MNPFEGLFAGTGDGVAVIDADLRILYWNEAAHELLGYSAEEVGDRYCYDIFKGMDEQGSILCNPNCSLLECSRRGERVHSRDLLTPRKDGNQTWINVSTIFIPYLSGHRNVIVHLFRDIDRWHRTREFVEDFVARVSEIELAPAPPPPAERSVPPPQLTKREREVLDLLSRGFTPKGIAKELTISEATASNHIQNILAKLGVHSRLEAALVALQHKLL